jgi:hypothetical protein
MVLNVVMLRLRDDGSEYMMLRLRDDGSENTGVKIT